MATEVFLLFHSASTCRPVCSMPPCAFFRLSMLVSPRTGAGLGLMELTRVTYGLGSAAACTLAWQRTH